MPAVLPALAGAENSIERWWQRLEAAQKHPDGSFKVINALAMAASYDPDPSQYLGIRLPVTFDTCEIIEERWANWLRHDPVVVLEGQADNLQVLRMKLRGHSDLAVLRLIRSPLRLLMILLPALP
jgi:hypothetical protein